jgi:hypothetical protein
MSRRQRTSESQIQRLRQGLSERDLAVLRSVRSYRLMNAAQVQRVHFASHASTQTSQRVCRRVLKRLHQIDLLKRLERRIGGIRAGSAGHVHALTPLGHRILGTSNRKRWREPSASFVDHTLAIAELGSLAVRLTLDAGHEVLSVEPEPDAWRTYHDGYIETVVKPDLAMTLADETSERSWFVEVDLDTESRTVIQRKCQIYTNYWRTGIEQREHDVFPQVLWVTPDERRSAQIASTFDRPGVEPRLFHVTTADRAPRLLAGINARQVMQVTKSKGDSL